MEIVVLYQGPEAGGGGAYRRRLNRKNAMARTVPVPATMKTNVRISSRVKPT